MRRRSRSRLLAAASGALLLGLALPARASAPAQVGFGARSRALASADIAAPRGAAAHHVNPAALAHGERLSVEVGYSATVWQLRGGETPPVEPTLGWEVGFVARGRLFDVPIGVGLATWLPDGHLSQSRGVLADEPTWVLLGNRLQTAYLSANVAVELVPGLSVAAGFAALSATDGAFDVRGTAVLPVFERSEFESSLEHRVEARVGVAYFPQFGALWQAADGTRFGLVYRESASLTTELRGELMGDLDTGLGLVPVRYRFRSVTVSEFEPRELGLGLGKRLSFGWAFVQLRYRDWSAFESPVAVTEAELEVDAPPGVELNVPDVSSPAAVAEPNWHDTVSTHLGWELPVIGAEPHEARSDSRGPRLDLRFGYAFEPTPVPDQQLGLQLVGNDLHSLSVGGGLELPAGALKLRVDWVGRVGLASDRGYQFGAGPRSEFGASALATGVSVSLSEP